jgi:hypothetical protein
LQDGAFKFDFLGITSNGTDCIYFLRDENYFAIEYEVMIEEQKVWIEKLQSFAWQNKYSTMMTTYGNKPKYKSIDPAPVLRIETKSNKEQTAIIGARIMEEVFGNNERTMYDLVHY